MVGAHLHQAVVDEHPRPGLQILGQVLVGDGNNLVVALPLPGGQGEGGAGLQLDGAVLKGLHPDFRALGIQNGGDGQAQLPAQAGDSLQLFGGVLMGAVGKIEPRGVHAAQHQAAQDSLVLGGGPQRTDDFRLSQHSTPSFPIPGHCARPVFIVPRGTAPLTEIKKYLVLV